MIVEGQDLGVAGEQHESAGVVNPTGDPEPSEVYESSTE